MTDDRHVVVVGAGLAGAHVVRALRARGFTGALTLLGSENELPYDRTKLSKEYLQGRMDRAKLFLKTDWYQGHDVRLRLGETVVEVDRRSHTVRLASGTALAYDWLVLATGARSRRLRLPGMDLPGVLTLRDLHDCDALRDVLARGGRLAIVGAGWIGLEVAATAAQAGLQVTVVAPNRQPLDNVLGEQVGAHFAGLHRRHGVDLRLETAVQGVLERAGRAVGLDTSAGEVEADAVLVAVGAIPNTELAEQAGLQVSDGVVVDSRLRTTDPAVLAVGDIANAWNSRLGQRLRREHWDNALRQGKLAAATILDLPGEYDWLPYFYTDQFDLGMEYVGNNAADDQTVIRGSLASGEFIVFWLRDAAVTAAMNVNIWEVSTTLRALVGREIDPARLQDPRVELADL